MASTNCTQVYCNIEFNLHQGIIVPQSIFNDIIEKVKLYISEKKDFSTVKSGIYKGLSSELAHKALFTAQLAFYQFCKKVNRHKSIEYVPEVVEDYYLPINGYCKIQNPETLENEEIKFTGFSNLIQGSPARNVLNKSSSGICVSTEYQWLNKTRDAVPGLTGARYRLSADLFYAFENTLITNNFVRINYDSNNDSLLIVDSNGEEIDLFSLFGYVKGKAKKVVSDVVSPLHNNLLRALKIFTSWHVQQKISQEEREKDERVRAEEVRLSSSSQQIESDLKNQGFSDKKIASTIESLKHVVRKTRSMADQWNETFKDHRYSLQRGSRYNTVLNLIPSNCHQFLRHSDGSKLVYFDSKTSQPRILASLANDQELLENMKTTDIYTIFGQNRGIKSKNFRKRAKKSFVVTLFGDLSKAKNSEPGFHYSLTQTFDSLGNGNTSKLLKRFIQAGHQPRHLALILQRKEAEQMRMIEKALTEAGIWYMTKIDAFFVREQDQDKFKEIVSTLDIAMQF